MVGTSPTSTFGSRLAPGRSTKVCYIPLYKVHRAGNSGGRLVPDFATALQYVPRLYQLELFFPSLEEELEDMWNIVRDMCHRGKPAVMKCRGWHSVLIGDEEFWGAPSCGVGNDRCTQASRQSSG